MDHGCLFTCQVIGSSKARGEGVVDRVYNAAWKIVEQGLHLWIVVNGRRDHLFRFLGEAGTRQNKAVERGGSSCDKTAREVDGCGLHRIIEIRIEERCVVWPAGDWGHVLPA